MKNVVKGVSISLISTLVLLIIFSLILTFTNVSENVINPVIILITVVSILIGSTLGNIHIKKNGLLNGALVGGIYIILIYFISSFMNFKFYLNIESIIMIISSLIFGTLGGIIAVNKT